ncbi:hypothetical protein BC831DRAFT_452267 [Entophlyctis helioformis]|nr:hypothetical protein BC831DRAFT_452267 [Entophlyctis helioformis]
MKIVDSPLIIDYRLVHIATLPWVPILFFLLNRVKAIPTAPLALALATVQAIIPLVIDTNSPLGIANTSVVFSSLVIALRLIDIATLNQSTTKRWSLMTYAQYFATFDTNESRALRQAQMEKRAQHPSGFTARRYLERQITADKRDTTYYMWFAVSLFLQYAAYSACIYYIEHTTIEHNLPLRQPLIFFVTPLKTIMDTYVMSIVICLLLNMGYTVVYHIFAEIFQTPFDPMMDNPFVSNSFRDFWSVRWNMMIKETLHRITFKPTMIALHILTVASGSKAVRKPDYKAPDWHMSLAAFNAFLFSALFHEWLILALMKNPTTWEQFMFFTIHGLFSVGEVNFLKFIRFYPAIESMVLAIPNWFSIFLTSTLFMALSPFFLNPYVREDFFIKDGRLPTLF